MSDLAPFRAVLRLPPLPGDRRAHAGRRAASSSSSNISGQFNLWSARVDGGWPDQLTTFTENTVRGVAVREDGTILFLADRDGDEFHQLYRIPAGGGWPEQLTDLPQVQHVIGAGAWSPDGTSFAFSANSRQPEDSEVFIWREGDDAPRYLFGEGMYAFPAAFSPDGTKLVGARVPLEQRHRRSILIDVETGDATELTPHEVDAKFLPGPVGGRRLGLLRADRRGARVHGARVPAARHGRRANGSRRPSATSTSSQARPTAACSPGSRTTTASAACASATSRRGKRPARAEAAEGHGIGLRLRACRSRATASRARARLGPACPAAGDLRRRDGERRGAARDREPRRRARRARRCASPELIRYPSFDGREIPAWLYRPDGDGPAPFVVAIHGGPEAQEKPVYRPRLPVPARAAASACSRRTSAARPATARRTRSSSTTTGAAPTSRTGVTPPSG